MSDRENCPIKLKLKPAMASMSYLQKFVLVSVSQNLSPGTTTIQCHLETGHTKMILSFRNLFRVKRSKQGLWYKIAHFLKIFWMKIEKILPLEKASNMDFQREREVTQQWLNLVSKWRHENKYIYQWIILRLINSQSHYNLVVLFICDIIC